MTIQDDGRRGTYTNLTTIVGQWAAANAKPIEPTKDSYKDLTTKQMAESIRRGYKLFTDPQGQGQLHRLPRRITAGRCPSATTSGARWCGRSNLTPGVYRGGRRPIDLFWRIKRGIGPSGMPAEPASADDEDVWDVVEFRPGDALSRDAAGGHARQDLRRPPKEHGGEVGNACSRRQASSLPLCRRTPALRGYILEECSSCRSGGASSSALVLSAILALCLVSPFIGWWMPQNIASYGGEVDYLFYIILAFTGFFFVLTEAILVYVMYRYAYDPNRKADYVEGNHRLEMLWTMVPAGILLSIAFAQIRAWERIKYQALMPGAGPGRAGDRPAMGVAHALPAESRKSDAEGRAWAEAPEIDDIHLPNELHTWKAPTSRCISRRRT